MILNYSRLLSIIKSMKMHTGWVAVSLAAITAIMITFSAPLEAGAQLDPLKIGVD